MSTAQSKLEQQEFHLGSIIAAVQYDYNNVFWNYKEKFAGQKGKTIKIFSRGKIPAKSSFWKLTFFFETQFY